MHDTLYASDELSRVPIAGYLTKLCDNLVRLRPDRANVTVQVDVQDADIGLDQAVTLGLITTELVTNALKHAFPSEEPGRVTVSFRCEHGECLLVVADDGVGIKDMAAGTGPRSGLRLLASLALQLGATVSQGSAIGTRFKLRFPQR